MVRYEVDWGDGNETIVSGVELKDRRNIDDPHSVFHMYSYWEVWDKHDELDSAHCDENECVVDIKVRIKDNWGFYSDWVELADPIRIKRSG